MWLAGSGAVPASAQGLDTSSLFPHEDLAAQAQLEDAQPEQSEQDHPTVAGWAGRTGTDVAGAFGDSLKLLLLEHAIRVSFQEKTRRELTGPFWGDYRRSVRIPAQWEDSDSALVNYIGHPIHGAAAGYAWLDHGPDGRHEFGAGRGYWAGRARAMAWAAAYSLQFEIGPLSEASIGNVGLRPETAGWVDHVVTPVGAFGLIVAEDALDRFLVSWLERHTTNRVWRASLRLMFNPARTLSNSASGKSPWYRNGRPLDWR